MAGICDHSRTIKETIVNAQRGICLFARGAARF